MGVVGRDRFTIFVLGAPASLRAGFAKKRPSLSGKGSPGARVEIANGRSGHQIQSGKSIGVGWSIPNMSRSV